MKKIAFFLPGISPSPVGGYKVVYEYANRLVQDGYKVDIYYPSYIYTSAALYIKILRYAKAILRFLYYKLFRVPCKTSWFTLDDRIQERFVLSLSDIYISKYDTYVATAVETAISLNKFKNAKKIYLIQHYEAWGNVSEEELLETYNYPFKKFVISTWLKKIVDKYDPSCILLPNGFDFKFFKKDTCIDERNKYCIAMLCHKTEWKGCQDGYNALNIVKSRFPQLKVNLFGVCERPIDLPEWYIYYQKPDMSTFNKIYNEAAIFLGTSWTEGWGLTVGEAMACGCAIVCTDNDGYLEMVKPNISALVSPIKNPQALADNIIRIIENDNIRYDMANRGYQDIQKFTWEQSYNILKHSIDTI